MKQFLLLCTVAFLSITNTWGYDYHYLVLEKSNGTKVTISTTDITLSVSGTTSATITVDGTSYEVTDLSKMYFTNTASETQTVTIPSIGWATFCSTNALDYTNVSGLKAYTATFDGQSISLSELTTAIPAGTGIILQGTAGNYNIPVMACANNLSSNDLEGTTTGVIADDSYNYYALGQIGNTAVGFRLVSTGVTIPANKAYYRTTDAQAPAVAYTLSETTSTVSDNTVEIVYSGSTATVTIADNISNYVTCSSGTSSHVVLVQNSNFAGIDATADNEDGEIIYSLSGTSDDGEFYLEGAYKCTVELNGLTLTNPSGPAINVQNGKRVALSAQKGTTNTLVDGANDTYNGCFHCKGHTKLKGKGILNIVGNSKHAIYSKEYIEVKNLTLNVTGAVKDGIHCKQYFLMESGAVTISGAGDDAIQVELKDTNTGETVDHEDEDTGNFYMEGGTLTISGYTGKAVKADGTISFIGGTQNFDTTDIEENASTTAITETLSSESTSGSEYFDMQGRKVTGTAPGLYIVKRGNTTRKVIVK